MSPDGLTTALVLKSGYLQTEKVMESPTMMMELLSLAFWAAMLCDATREPNGGISLVDSSLEQEHKERARQKNVAWNKLIVIAFS